MKGVSEALTTLIIAATIIITSITVFYFAIANLQQATLSAEYGYIRSIFIGVADTLPDILEGGTYASRLPSRLVGIGYINLSDTRLEIIVINNSNIIFNYTDQPMALHASAYASLVVNERTVYGVNKYVVNETLLLPRVREYYLNGATHLTLDTARFYVKVYVYEMNGETTYVVNIIYAKLVVKILSSKPSQLTVSLGKTVLYDRLVDIDELKLKYISGGTTHTTDLDDLIPNPVPGSHYIINILIKNIDAVII